VHEGKVEILRADDGAFRFVRANGIPYDAPMPAETQHIGITRLIAAHQARQVEITPKTAIPAMTDSGMDYDLAVSWLLSNDAWRKNVSAETSKSRSIDTLASPLLGPP
jgi:hypothetical protein